MRWVILLCALAVGGVYGEEKPVKPPAPPEDATVKGADKGEDKGVAAAEPAEKPRKKVKVAPPPEKKKSKKELEAERQAEIDARAEKLNEHLINHPAWTVLSDIEKIQVRIMAGKIASGEMKQMSKAEYMNLDSKTQAYVKAFFFFMVK